MGEAAVAIAAALLATACNTGSPASPTFESSPFPDATTEEVDAGEAGAVYAVCPPGIDASFGSIYGLMLSSTASCGGNNDNCHSTVGAVNNESHMDFSLDAGGVYVELLGPDGGGQISQNVDSPNVKVLRVDPGDAGASMLYIKLITTSSLDPNYGSGMPLTDPGSVCPATVQAVKDWINAGAAKN
jgi:hypothetical protein